MDGPKKLSFRRLGILHHHGPCIATKIALGLNDDILSKEVPYRLSTACELDLLSPQTLSSPTRQELTMPNQKNPTVVSRTLAVLGARGVGKSSLTNSFVTGTFSDAYDPTIESTQHKIIRFRKVHFATDIVDTAGMDEYSRLSRNASLGVHGYVLVFSIASRQSFDTICQINKALLSTLGDAPDVPRVLVGSMKDRSEARQVSQKDAQNLAASWGVPYLECSSKTGERIADIFHTLIKEVEKDDGLLTESDDSGCIIS